MWLRREMTFSDRLPVVVMVVVAIALTVFGAVSPDWVPYQVMVLPMFVGSLWLGPKAVPWYVVFCLLGVCAMLAAHPVTTSRGVVSVVIAFTIGILIVVTSFRRARLGVSGTRSESMFVDLRDRIAKQGQLPSLPEGWTVQSVTRSAGGTAFAGDFVVASREQDGRTLELVVVDVSGKGVEAGTRALLLSGAFGGLLSALPPGQFLPAASDFLLRQQWEEGFATAIHLHLDTATGDFELRKAGHPPAIWIRAGSGTWRVLDSDGPVLGVLEAPAFELVSGTLGLGDALMLYTDGLVETTRRDIGSGIDRLAGRGQRLVQHGFEDGAKRIVDDLEPGNDDCALVIVHRR
jgi:stage II sporulation SpoE-like protein